MDQNLDHAVGVGQKFGSEFGLVCDPNLDFWITAAGDGLITNFFFSSLK